MSSVYSCVTQSIKIDRICAYISIFLVGNYSVRAKGRLSLIYLYI